MSRFERIHEETYRKFGFELVMVEPVDLLQRVSLIKRNSIRRNGRNRESRCNRILPASKMRSIRTVHDRFA
jgi:hypothetical protein